MSGFVVLVPDGSMEKITQELLEAAGIKVRFPPRGYRGRIESPDLFDPKRDTVIRLRPWDTPQLVAEGKAHLGFAGYDCVAESGRIDDLVIVRQLPLSRGGVGKTRIVLAVPDGSPIKSVKDLTAEHTVVTEYPRLAAEFMARSGVDSQIIAVRGSTEAHHSDVEFADAIIENTETGSSLQANNWHEIEPIMESQFCLIANKAAEFNAKVSAMIEQVRFLLDAVMAARGNKLVKFNVASTDLEAALKVLPTGSPTINNLANSIGYAVELVVEENQINPLISRLRQAGADRIIQTDLEKFVL